jgi:dihydrofolate reductase
VKDEDPDNVFVIGGGAIYRQMLPFCTRAYVTRIDNIFDADTFFPDLDSDPEWEIESESETMNYEGISYRFVIYKKK